MSIILLLTGHLTRVTEGYTTPSHVRMLYIWRKGERNGVYTHPYSSQIINGPHLDVTRLSTAFCAKTVTGNQVLETRKKRGIDKNRVMHSPHTYILRCIEEGDRMYICTSCWQLPNAGLTAALLVPLEALNVPIRGKIYFPNNNLTIH